MKKVYPNPLSLNEALTIEMSDSYKNSTLIIYNDLGQIIFQNKLSKRKNRVLLGISKGSYNLLILNKENNYSSKLIVH